MRCRLAVYAREKLLYALVFEQDKCLVPTLDFQAHRNGSVNQKRTHLLMNHAQNRRSGFHDGQYCPGERGRFDRCADGDAQVSTDFGRAEPADEDFAVA